MIIILISAKRTQRTPAAQATQHGGKEADTIPVSAVVSALYPDDRDADSAPATALAWDMPVW